MLPWFPYILTVAVALFALSTAITWAVLSLGSVLDFADAALFALAFVNIIGLYLLLPVVRRELRDYMAHRRGETVAVNDVDVTG
ncbi:MULTISPECIES: alanine:cation symporter family protein [unclassified Rhodococcus (in: high G+C Gram-positive bacteria)]|uniref:alanine:cation symporter family protein n=1 Tax=unclassified Rhodococcus (in: high G+C Gram-positive bacteria) TaxID=192944 RepID=UPI0006F27DCE|nr:MULTISPECIES: alanine:cation symporter family protein [unclassified Rhodococcus (in: high G+C Gram-positive bacteria)]KQU36408.1 hypothetical protein ASG69_19425 [Rhodococcus sp. Leaf225]KQU48954.1 hypothetical protein ASH03_03890 [Rhodococcus sp. Leaf258]